MFCQRERRGAHRVQVIDCHTASPRRLVAIRRDERGATDQAPKCGQRIVLQSEPPALAIITGSITSGTARASAGRIAFPPRPMIARRPSMPVLIAATGNASSTA